MRARDRASCVLAVFLGSFSCTPAQVSRLNHSVSSVDVSLRDCLDHFPNEGWPSRTPLPSHPARRRRSEIRFDIVFLKSSLGFLDWAVAGGFTGGCWLRGATSLWVHGNAIRGGWSRVAWRHSCLRRWGCRWRRRRGECWGVRRRARPAGAAAMRVGCPGRWGGVRGRTGGLRLGGVRSRTARAVVRVGAVGPLPWPWAGAPPRWSCAGRRRPAAGAAGTGTWA